MTMGGGLDKYCFTLDYSISIRTSSTPNVQLNPTAYRVLRLHSVAPLPANSYPMYGGGLT